MSKTGRLSLLAIAAVALFEVGTPVAAEAQSVMKMASATINDVQHEWQKVFAEELAARVGDQVTVEIYPASQLGTIPRMAEGVLLGTIESFITPTAFLVGAEPKFKVFDAPGLFDSPEHLGRTIHDPAYRDHLETMALDKGFRVIGAIYNSPFVVLTKKPAPKKAIGANPLPLPLSEVVPALQSGNIDGMLAGMPILVAFKYYDIAKPVTDLQFSMIVSVNIVNEAWFQSQSPEVQAAIREAGRAAEEKVLQWGIDNVARTNAVWLEKGGEIYELSPEDQARMTEVFKTVSDRILSADAEVAGEYETLLSVVNASR